jgi:hypothetical protein
LLDSFHRLSDEVLPLRAWRYIFKVAADEDARLEVAILLAGALGH